MQLKNYQVKALEILKKFLTDAQVDIKAAFEKNQDAPNYSPRYQALNNLPKVPYICLRLPTGGGKTLLATKAIQIAAENFYEREYPFVLWLVPTKEIRQQTLKVLRSTNNFYGQILRESFRQVNIFDVTEFRQLKPYDLTNCLNICVATFQSFKITDKEGRKVYQSDEELESCFENISSQEYFCVDNRGYSSFANLVAYLRPLMIVDEAHNNSTTLSFETMEFLRPSAVIELTATPARNSNVLVKITAEELNKEDMLKLPVVLGEVSNSPEKTLDSAIQRRAALEKISYAETDYIRPITLYQAQNITGEYNVDYIKKYLVEVAKVPENEIAIATGERRELNGVNLLARNCAIRHIITVQALKEGWDCPFAAVFCSLAKVHSPKDAEQLLGRVLRMPYTKRRSFEELNKAYAFILADGWNEAVNQLEEDLLHMGFEKDEVKKTILQTTLNYTDTIKIHTDELPNKDILNLMLQAKISVEKVDDGYDVTFQDISDDDKIELAKNKNVVFKKSDDREKLLKGIYLDHIQPKGTSPAERGVEFSVPQLCFDFGNGAQVKADREDFLPDDWKITDTRDYSLPLSKVDSQIKYHEFDLRGNRLMHRFLGDEQNLFAGITNWTQNEIIGWLSTKIEHKIIGAADFVEFTRRILNQLVNEKDFTLEELVRRRFSLKKFLEEKIDRCIDDAAKSNWKMKIFEGKSFMRVNKDIAFMFKLKNYSPRNEYKGNHEFRKHYYPKIGDMNNEEIFCAQIIDGSSKVKTWVRNLENDDDAFFLQLYDRKFFPDFVIMLNDGNFAAIEYKGAHLITGDDAQEKNLVGEIWANASNGICKFKMVTAKDNFGRQLSTQLEETFC